MSIETVDDDARWAEIQEMSRRIAHADEPPSRLESALCGAVVRAQDALRRPSQDAFNRLSVLHGEMFKIACELFQMQKNGEQLAERGLAKYERLIYGEGRPVKPHATGPTLNTALPERCPRCGGTLGCGALCITTEGHSECGSVPKEK